MPQIKDQASLRKITLKNCGITQKTVRSKVDKLADGEGVALLRVVGIVTSFKPGATTMGEFLKLFGEMRAINLLTGESFQANQMILPNFVSEGLAATLQQGGGNAEFALEFSAHAQEDSATGYVYTARNLIEQKVSDRMAELIKAASAGLPALPAPDASNVTPVTKARAKKAA